MQRYYFKSLIILVIIPCFMLGLTLRPVQVRAGMVATADVVALANRDALQAKVAAFVERQDVRQVMVRQGVNVEEARNRLQVMSDAELMAVAEQIDKLPAGGDAAGAIVGAALLIFVILLLTDLLGLTDVFPFVN